MLLLRALLAFLAMPAIVAFIIPSWISPSQGTDTAGAILALLGLIGLLWCVRDFYVIGRGTLAPWDPPKRLVAVGLYRVCRNPMYVSVVTLIAGQAWWRHSWQTALYAAFVAVATHLRVTLYEEPLLARSFPEDWAAYSAKVGRWGPKVRSASANAAHPPDERQ
jgi:protein-S-isoprenylcysteine O-methyltransferase Ste14